MDNIEKDIYKRRMWNATVGKLSLLRYCSSEACHFIEARMRMNAAWIKEYEDDLQLQIRDARSI